jgi:hypothetical protein
MKVKEFTREELYSKDTVLKDFELSVSCELTLQVSMDETIIAAGFYYSASTYQAQRPAANLRSFVRADPVEARRW